MKTVTVEQFLSFNPCYGEERIRRIAGDKTEWTALDILNLRHVPAEDKLWAVLREELIDEPVLHEIACRCAEMALELVDNPDPRSLAAIKAKRRWLRGEIGDDELDAARDAAWYAARDAAWYAARDAARDAAWFAARVAARVAAWDEASDAARKEQVKMIKEMLEGARDER